MGVLNELKTHEFTETRIDLRCIWRSLTYGPSPFPDFFFFPTPLDNSFREVSSG